MCKRGCRELVPVAVACWLLAIMLAGCGPRGPERVIISGEVTFQAKPLPTGTIYFEPCNDKSQSLMAAAIVDGQYKMDSLGGLPVGEYKVRIEAARERVSSDLSNQQQFVPQPRGGQYIPAKYNTNTELKIKVESGRRSAVHDFALTE
jgi:hypothetical protein